MMMSFSCNGHDPGGSHRPFAKIAKLDLSVPGDSRAQEGKSLAADAPPGPVPGSAPEAGDEHQFLNAVAGTHEIAGDRRRAGAPRPSRRAKPPDDDEVLAELTDLCDGRGDFDVTDASEFMEGAATGIDRRLLKQLRAGQYAVQAHLDLHGMTRDEAGDRVAKFVAQCRAAHKRCVLVVHGRGRHSDDQVPVLKQELRRWLSRGEIARSVLAFSTARPADGGAGAVYVLLRK